ncbi:hypothetical protein PENSUB_2713 [Penicillium subrubescens]|jgi:hypothetical protein|uniref:Uncharacterized protein n=1 Tax=Penicillium subrubescens TaxID=1316194 RepID=A0A1Q5UGP9_9EURO|nr:hypothetical protein PENSUB_2713 [Penicillium subrubescens]
MTTTLIYFIFLPLILNPPRPLTTKALIDRLPKALGRTPKALSSASCRLAYPFSRATNGGTKATHDVTNCTGRPLKCFAYGLGETAFDGV